MPTPKQRAGRSRQPERQGDEYGLLLQVERYESLAEEMEELGVTTLEEVRRAIAELHRRLDAEEGE